MQRRLVLGCIAAASLLVLLFVITGRRSNPRFVPAAADFKIEKYDHLSYPFLLASPFEHGLVWLTVGDQTRAHCYLYDIEQTKVIGELENGWVVLGNRDQSKVLLSDASPSMKETFLRQLSTATAHLINVSFSKRREAVAVFDRQEEKARTAGEIYQGQGSGSTWCLSPDFRFAFTKPTSSPSSEVVICNLDDATMSPHTLTGWPIGWWTNDAILLSTEDYGFGIYDIAKRQTSILTSPDEIKAFVADNKIAANPAKGGVHPFAQWDGHQYNFYYTEAHKRWEATNSFLAKVERPSGKLKLLSADFAFRWSDSIDPTERFYVYSGRDFTNSEKIDAVYVRDLQTGKTRTLVESIGQKQHSIPRLYGNSVIYSRTNTLWRIDLDRTHARRIFPPPNS